MKQRDLLFAGLLLLGTPAFAQDGPTRTSKDSKVIFVQDFESDFATWSSTPVDSITVIEYYDHAGNSDLGGQSAVQPWNDRANWQRGLFRTDSTILLMNGVLPTDNLKEQQAKNFPNESYDIIEDVSTERKDAFKKFGESDEGGDYVFKYVSDTCTLAASSYGTYKGGYTANYRRNMFVRNLPIEENTSYRLSFYVKANPIPGHSADAAPRMYADVMRGYYKSEKPFSMGVENDTAHYKYNTAFAYEKNEFSGDWEKVTFMTYYLNDSIADDFVFTDGYWWAADSSWYWPSTYPENTSGKDLFYAVQPDKFFVRMSFASDYTTFFVDNISLTKSTIAGAEYYNDKLRIDFGYKTNLSDLAAAAKAKTNIGAVEVDATDAADWLKESGNYEDRFEVWGYNGAWEPIYIRSAEYHDDGYMYMFTSAEINPVTGEMVPLQFDDYDTILVTFHNPIDKPELMLKYTGDGTNVANAFPQALDTTWIKNGKIVPDFYNEIATPNPYVFAGVYSLNDLPPVFQGAAIPDGSFFLEPQKEFKFKFSREVWVEENLSDDQLDNTYAAIAYVNDKTWRVSFDKTTDTLTITCPDDTWKNLNGDVVIQLNQIMSKGGLDYGANVVLNYNFGAPNRNVSIDLPQIDLSFTMTGAHPSVPRGVLTYSNSTKTYGDGSVNNTGNLNKMYTHNDGAIRKGYEVRPHGGNMGGHVYLGADTLAGDPDYTITLAKGGYTFKFKGTGWSWNNGAVQPVTVYVFKNVKDPTSVSSSNKMQIGVYNPSAASDDGDLQNIDYAIPAANVDEVTYTFNISEDGDYIIEFNNKAGAWSQGSFVGDFELYQGVVSSYIGIVTDLNNALANAKSCAEESEVDLEIYGGEAYLALTEKIEYYKIGGAFDQLSETDPSVWTAAKKELDDATAAQSDRMAKIKLMEPELETLNTTAQEASADEQILYEYKAIAAASDLYADIDYTKMTVDSIVKATDDFKALVKALNDHRTKIDDFVKLLASVDEQLANTDYASFKEFQDMDSVFNVYEEYDVYNNTLADLNSAYNAVQASFDAWNGKYNTKGIYDMQIVGLESLIATLDGNVPEGVKNLDALLDDKVGFYMLYASKALYESILDDPTIDSIDVSAAFITNGSLYTTIRASQLGGGDHCLMNESVGGAPLDLDFFPGWTYTFKKGNPYIGGTSWGAGKASTDGKPRDTYINLDWNTGFVLEQTIADLPAGKYTLGVGYGIAPAANDGSFKVYELGDEDVLIADTAFYTNDGAGGTGSGTKANNFLSFENKNGVRLFINPSCGDNGWNSFDNITLQFIKAVEDFDYETALEEVEAAITEKLKTTAVISTKAVKGVKYYDVNGVELKAPKSGLNIIVVDGVATKVLVK